MTTADAADAADDYLRFTSVLGSVTIAVTTHIDTVCVHYAHTDFKKGHKVEWQFFFLFSAKCKRVLRFCLKVSNLEYLADNLNETTKK